MIGTYLTVPEAQRKVSPEQRVQVNKRAAQVSQGSIIEERIQKAFVQALQGKTGDDWKKLHDDYYQKGEDFDAKHQQALELYRRLTESPFQNQDDVDKNKVQSQNKLLQETCSALNEGLSKTSMFVVGRTEVERLNSQVAALSAAVSQ